MSQTFFDELGVPSPDYNLGIGSGTHGHQTAQILLRLEEVLIEENPVLVIVRGDTNSTVASALAASKLNIPVAHIEAGERSYNRQMPEEINRLVTDSIADHHFCVSKEAIKRLAVENIVQSVHWVGDVMLDLMFQKLPIARKKSKILDQLNLKPNEYALVTIHRSTNTDELERIANIIKALNQTDEVVVFPVHPRTRNVLEQSDLELEDNVLMIDPVSYFDIVILEENARLIATDSGGVQREAYFLGIPCLTLRDETEWIETVNVGWNKLVGTDPSAILAAWFDFKPDGDRPPIFGDGTAGERILHILNSIYS